MNCAPATSATMLKSMGNGFSIWCAICLNSETLSDRLLESSCSIRVFSSRGRKTLLRGSRF
jgi:hypothetical protein